VKKIVPAIALLREHHNISLKTMFPEHLLAPQEAILDLTISNIVESDRFFDTMTFKFVQFKYQYFTFLIDFK
jgi:hypothetical protein